MLSYDNYMQFDIKTLEIDNLYLFTYILLIFSLDYMYLHIAS